MAPPFRPAWTCVCGSLNLGRQTECEACGESQPRAVSAPPAVAAPVSRPPVSDRARAYGLACIQHMAELPRQGSGQSWPPGRHEAWIRQMAREFPEYYREPSAEVEIAAWTHRKAKSTTAKRIERIQGILDRVPMDDPVPDWVTEEV